MHIGGVLDVMGILTQRIPQTPVNVNVIIETMMTVGRSNYTQRSRRMAIKVGEVVILKSTEEPCFCLSIDPGQGDPGYPELSGTSVTVKRPVATRDGIEHVVEVRAIEELETIQDRVGRLAKEYSQYQASKITDTKVEPVSKLCYSHELERRKKKSALKVNVPPKG